VDAGLRNKEKNIKIEKGEWKGLRLCRKEGGKHLPARDFFLISRKRGRLGGTKSEKGKTRKEKMFPPRAEERGTAEGEHVLRQFVDRQALHVQKRDQWR